MGMWHMRGCVEGASPGRWVAAFTLIIDWYMWRAMILQSGSMTAKMPSSFGRPTASDTSACTRVTSSPLTYSRTHIWYFSVTSSRRSTEEDGGRKSSSTAILP